MSTTHLIAINGDFIDVARADPKLFADAIILLCRHSGMAPLAAETALDFGVVYLTESMNGVEGALKRATGR